MSYLDEVVVSKTRETAVRKLKCKATAAAKRTELKLTGRTLIMPPRIVETLKRQNENTCREQQNNDNFWSSGVLAKGGKPWSAKNSRGT